MSIDDLVQSLRSAGIERARARYVVADALAVERGYGPRSGGDGAQLLRAADAEIEARQVPA